MLQGSTAMRGLNGTLGLATPTDCEIMYGENSPYCTPSAGSGSSPGAGTGKGWTIANNLVDIGSKIWNTINSGAQGASGGGVNVQQPNNTMRYIVTGGVIIAAIGVTVALINSSKKK